MDYDSELIKLKYLTDPQTNISTKAKKITIKNYQALTLRLLFSLINLICKTSFIFWCRNVVEGRQTLRSSLVRILSNQLEVSIVTDQ